MMQNQNKLLAKSNTINILGLAGLALALLGMLIPSVRVSYMGFGQSGTMFQMTLWTLVPLILLLGAAALYVLKMDLMAVLATIVTVVAFHLVMVISCAAGSSELSGSGIGIHYSIGWYFAMLGFMVAIAAYWVNGLIFKNVGQKAPAQNFDPNMQQANPYMQQGQQQFNQNVQQAGQYMQQGQQQFNQNVQQAGQYVQQGQQQFNQNVQQGQQQFNQNVQQAGQYAQDQAQQFTNNNQQ